MKKENIIKLLWWAFGIKVVYFVCMVLIILNQKVMKKLLGFTGNIGDLFVMPIDSVVLEIAGVVLMMILIIVINNELKEEKTAIGVEITSVVLFGGLLDVITYLGNILVSRCVALEGTEALASYMAVKSSISTFSLFSRISSTIFILACGMAIACKKNIKI